MEKANIKRVINLVCEPGNFKNLNKLNDNILAYGEMEYLLGHYKGIFKEFRELCDEVTDLRVALELSNVIMMHMEYNAPKELLPIVKKNINGMIVALVHNINKNTNKYGINK